MSHDEERVPRRVLVASYFFPPSSAVGGRRPARLARLLPDFGYQCDVICASAENAAEPADASLWSLIPEGLTVHRVDTPFVFGRNPADLPPRGFARLGSKARTYAEWLFVKHDWAWNWGHAAVSFLEGEPDGRQRYDALLLDAPPRLSVVPLLRWARKRGIPVLLDLRDLWAWEEDIRPGPFDLRPASRRRRWQLPLRDEAITDAAHVVMNSPEMADFMRTRFPDLPRDHFSSITNAFMKADPPSADAEEGWGERLRIVYTGSLAYGRLDQAKALIRGMGEFRRRGGGEVELVVAGDGADPLVETARQEGLNDNLRLLGRISQNEAVQVQRDADALLLLQPTDVGTNTAIPAKFFEYMERRRNIFGLLGVSPSARIIEEHGLGVVSAGEDPQSIAEALTRITDCVARCRRLPEPPEAYSERATVTDFADRLDRILGRK